MLKLLKIFFLYISLFFLNISKLLCISEEDKNRLAREMVEHAISDVKYVLF